MIKVDWGDFGTDRERAVLPAIIFVRNTLGFVSGWGLAIGWWKWGVRIMVITAPSPEEKPSE